MGDSNWRWTQTRRNHKLLLWDKTACPDKETCWHNCEIEKADEEYEGTYGVRSDGKALNLMCITDCPCSKNVGSRLYLLNTDKESCKMFKLKNREFTFCEWCELVVQRQ